MANSKERRHCNWPDCTRSGLFCSFCSYNCSSADLCVCVCVLILSLLCLWAGSTQPWCQTQILTAGFRGRAQGSTERGWVEDRSSLTSCLPLRWSGSDGKWYVSWPHHLRTSLTVFLQIHTKKFALCRSYWIHETSRFKLKGYTFFLLFEYKLLAHNGWFINFERSVQRHLL